MELVAKRSRPSGRRRSLRRSLLRAGLLALAALALVGCGTGGLVSEGAEIPEGKLLFTQKCGSCHTLRDAGTRGTIGPNLDDAFAGPREEGFEEDTIEEVVRHQIDYAAAPMPRDLVKGQQADDVAAYVAAVAGNPDAKVALPAGAGGNDPKLLFQSNCGSCHTLAEAGTSGTIGPNLDQVNPTLQQATRQIENGGGGMPPFKGQLTDPQIRALARYITGSGGG
jgi:cbb3-type cytochrome c oxidase subunit III